MKIKKNDDQAGAWRYLNKTMLNFILSLRIKQFFRGLTEIGFIRVVIIIPFMAIIILGLMENLLKRSLWEMFGFLALILVSLHFNRKDKHFLKVLKNQRYAVFSMEYLMASLPFLIWFFIENAWVQILATFILIGILPFIKWTFIYYDIKLKFLKPIIGPIFVIHSTLWACPPFHSGRAIPTTW